MIGLLNFPDFSANKIHSALDSAILNCLIKIRNHHNIKHITYVEHNQSKNDNSFQCILTYNSKWLLRYFTQSYYRIDPIFYHGFEKVSVIDWQDIKSQSEETEEFFEDAVAYGNGNQGIIIPTTTNINCLTNVSFTFDAANEEWLLMKEKSLNDWRVSANIIQSQINLLLHKNVSHNIYNLTSRELECLQWAAVGKTDKEIAKIIGISKYTVNGHMRNSKFKLDCVNRTSAIAKAISLGILEIRYNSIKNF